MFSSHALEGAVIPMGTHCAPGPNGYHMTDIDGVCFYCGIHTCEGKVWCKHVA